MSFANLLSLISAWPIGNPACWESLDGKFCGLFTKPLEAIQQPFISYFGVWFLVIVWATFIAIIWLRSQNPMMVAVVGIIFAFLIPSMDQRAIGVGMLLVALSIGITFYQLYQQRAQYPVT